MTLTDPGLDQLQDSLVVAELLLDVAPVSGDGQAQSEHLF